MTIAMPEPTVLPGSDAVLAAEMAATPVGAVLDRPAPAPSTPHAVDEDQADETDDVEEPTIQERFEDFHRANPWVYEHLHRLATELVDRGRTRIGIGMLWEVLRWQVELKTTTDDDDPFRLNNDYRSRYARLLAEKDPRLAHVFQTRALRAS